MLSTSTPANRRTRFVRVLAAISVVLATTTLLPADGAQAVVTASISNTAPSTDSNGYAWVSYYRHLAGLGSVTRNPTLEAQIALHNRYLADHALSCETDVHTELTSRSGVCGANRYATAAGKAAASNSDITRVSNWVPDRTAVSNWFGAAFHALVLLDPRLTSTGYSAYYTPNPRGSSPLAWRFTAGVDVYRGRQGSYSGATIAFPANNASTPLLSYTVGTESPEPFRTSTSGCRSWGTKRVVSAPVIVQWPLSVRTNPGTGTIIDLTTGRAQSTCSLNAGSYPVGSLPRQFLGGANGITKSGIYYADTPFIAGHRYQLRVGSSAVTTFWAGNLPAAPSVSASAGRGSVAVTHGYAAAGTGRVVAYVTRLFLGSSCAGPTKASVVGISNPTARFQHLKSGQTYSTNVATINSTSSGRSSACRAVRAG